jgi:hypothetical protein
MIIIIIIIIIIKIIIIKTRYENNERNIMMKRAPLDQPLRLGREPLRAAPQQWPSSRAATRRRTCKAVLKNKMYQHFFLFQKIINFSCGNLLLCQMVFCKVYVFFFKKKILKKKKGKGVAVYPAPTAPNTSMAMSRMAMDASRKAVTAAARMPAKWVTTWSAAGPGALTTARSRRNWAKRVGGSKVWPGCKAWSRAGTVGVRPASDAKPADQNGIEFFCFKMM